MKIKGIDWNDPDNRVKDIDIDALSRVCTLICADFRFKQGPIVFHVVSDEALFEMNVKHLNHHTLTDVITFPYNLGKFVSGEIFISADRADDNAKSNKSTGSEEVLRYAVHGMLHLCGLEDDTKDKKEEIHKQEDLYLRKYKEFHVKQ
ncbi:MAG: rRNA maturation RNase YbeY [Bacteroidetes bacterium GWF2_43_63]|nr:MAG: rRNA maturation RNase YbeY [Bacteroidetes bacterium GWE2_42_42]OFY54455.1 MAG: rRNA maturation RNase YbeY [Bacteroidetes bacterium GWF2_43_63]HBG70403.1 rRNA maturation RNase YbeY [Bacteroidales bacterium]HCB63480.1 rRNA maturation RNase YbeY [Bacteroidales bacterium]